MNDTFAYKQLSITNEQLDNLEFTEMSPTAREILQDSDVKGVKDLLSSDPERAAEAARALARDYFLVE